MASDESREAEAIDPAMGGWIQELDASLEAEPAPHAWAREAIASGGDHAAEWLPIVDARSVAAALYDVRGRRIFATDAFVAGGGGSLIDNNRLARTASAGELAWTQAEPGEGAEAGGAGVVVYAPVARAATWRVPVALHEAAQAHPAGVVVLTTLLEGRGAPLREACAAYGLTPLQSRVAMETIRLGGIRQAAAALGLAYQTAREALSDSMGKVGVDRLPHLVTRLTTLAFGVFPGQAASSDVMADAWGLTERQIALAGLVAEGVSRERIARALGLGLPVVKKELDTVYGLLQVGSSAALARRLAEARALSWLTAATAGGLGYVEEQSEPLRFAQRPDGGRIAFSDYGPASGRPVLVLHSSMTTRIVSRKLLRALHRAGFRPIAIDRPGFGLTDTLAGPGGLRDPFAAATADVARVLAHLKIGRVDIVSRGAAQFLVALAQREPAALGQVVLVNPGPPYRHSGRSIGPLGVVKDALVRNPAAARAVAPLLASQLTYRRLSRMVALWTRGSPPDEQAARDPEFVADFFRSVRMFATGRYEGFVQEQAAIAGGDKPTPFPGAAGWRVLLGSSDVLYDPDIVLAYWRELLPGARFTVVPDGGRFLAMTHADRVVAALDPD